MSRVPAMELRGVADYAGNFIVHAYRVVANQAALDLGVVLVSPLVFLLRTQRQSGAAAAATDAH